MYLIDTNVISEHRKGPRAHPGVVKFFEATPNNALYLPAQVIGEIQAGIAKLRRQNDTNAAEGAEIYQLWLGCLLGKFGNHVLRFDYEAASLWGAMLTSERKDPHTIDKQIAAMAIVNNLVLVTRDKQIALAANPAIEVLNSFDATGVVP